MATLVTKEKNKDTYNNMRLSGSGDKATTVGQRYLVNGLQEKMQKLSVQFLSLKGR
jgi:hypothetical protein